MKKTTPLKSQTGGSRRLCGLCSDPGRQTLHFESRTPDQTAGMKNLGASALKMLWRPIFFFSPQRSFSFQSCFFNVALPGRRNKNISRYQRGGYQCFSLQRQCLPQLKEGGGWEAVGGRLVSQLALNLCDISRVCSLDVKRGQAVLRHTKVQISGNERVKMKDKAKRRVLAATRQSRDAAAFSSLTRAAERITGFRKRFN